MKEGCVIIYFAVIRLFFIPIYIVCCFCVVVIFFCLWAMLVNCKNKQTNKTN